MTNKWLQLLHISESEQMRTKGKLIIQWIGLSNFRPRRRSVLQIAHCVEQYHCVWAWNFLHFFFLSFIFGWDKMWRKAEEKDREIECVRERLAHPAYRNNAMIAMAMSSTLFRINSFWCIIYLRSVVFGSFIHFSIFCFFFCSFSLSSLYFVFLSFDWFGCFHFFGCSYSSFHFPGCVYFTLYGNFFLDVVLKFFFCYCCCCCWWCFHWDVLLCVWLYSINEDD